MSDIFAKPESESPALSEQLVSDIEQASLRAWPALEEFELDNWRLRFSRGFTKRANSVSITSANDEAISQAVLLDRIKKCEQHYHDRKLPTIFRLLQTTVPATIDQVLASRNYRNCDASLVLVTELDSKAHASTFINYVDMQAWLTAYRHISDSTRQAENLHRLILKGIGAELLFALAERHHQSVACALGVLDGPLLGLFDIATYPDFRKQGFARALVQHLCALGLRSGAKYAYLQVQEDNFAAIALYASLGFSPAYRYGYRIEDEFDTIS